MIPEAFDEGRSPTAAPRDGDGRVPEDASSIASGGTTVGGGSSSRPAPTTTDVIARRSAEDRDPAKRTKEHSCAADAQEEETAREERDGGTRNDDDDDEEKEPPAATTEDSADDDDGVAYERGAIPSTIASARGAAARVGLAPPATASENARSGGRVQLAGVDDGASVPMARTEENAPRESEADVVREEGSGVIDDDDDDDDDEYVNGRTSPKRRATSTQNEDEGEDAVPEERLPDRQRRREVGYVLLEECEVLVPSSDLARLRDDGAIEGSGEHRAWRTLDLRTTRRASNPTADDAGAPNDDDDLVLRRTSSSPLHSGGGGGYGYAAVVAPFHGTLSEIAVLGESATDGRRRRRRRSDASLLAGLATEIDRQADALFPGADGDVDGDDERVLHLARARTERARIMFWDIGKKGSGEDVDGEAADGATNHRNDDGDVGKFARAKASLLLTFSLPTNEEGGIDGDNDDDDGLRRRDADRTADADRSRQERRSTTASPSSKSKGKRKMLSSAQQLLGSIVRCDWERLDAVMERLKRRRGPEGGGEEERRRRSRSERTPPPFFPDTLNVEELYDRISGARPGRLLGRAGDDERETTAENGDGEGGATTAAAPSRRSNDGAGQQWWPRRQPAIATSFLDLPEDVVATRVATFLRARSLRALRVACRKTMRSPSLGAVVPGLRLKLFRHQIRSLEWMEGRERRPVDEDDVLSVPAPLTSSDDRFDGGGGGGGEDGRGASSSSSSAYGCGGDRHRAVTGGSTVLLRPRPDRREGGGGGSFPMEEGTGAPLRFDSESGVLVAAPSLGASSRRTTRCARGGLLCDDPGLGKTITVLSLILRTFGLTTEPVSGDGRAKPDDDSLFHLYWNSSFLTEHVRRPALLRLVRRLVDSDADSVWFVPPIREYLDQCPDYLDVIPNPTCLRDVREKCDRSDCRDFEAFEADVGLCFSNAMAYNPPDHPVHEAAARLSEKFDGIVSSFKRNQIDVATKSISRMKNDPAARSLVDLLAARKRAELEGPLVVSSSTLLVVPAPLLRHWEDQMLAHVDFRYVSCRGDSPPIYYHTAKRKSKNSGTRVAFELSDVMNDPLVFIDDGSKALPPSDVLARFRVVLTSTSRFTSEWKHGSIEQEFRASKRGRGTYWGEEEAPEASPLLKVSWLRIIVDEGHVMGKNTNNLIQFASWLTAQRRWAMTGTPTQQIATQNGLKNLYFLANFLNHQFFDRRLGREKVWNSLIGQGWKYGHLSSFFRLRHLISYLMVRHTKQDLVEIPAPVFTVSDIRLSQTETTTYNTIVSGIRTNIITTSMDGKTSGWQDSLLNPRQSKFASEALTNLRVACCGGLQILPHILNKHWSETLEMLRDIHHLDDVRVQIVNNFIHRAQSAELSSCYCCGIQVQTLFVIPCGHLVCTECIDSETKSCPVCEQPFDADDFQRLQPGLNFQFSLNILEEKKECEKQNTLQRVLADSTRPGVVDIDDLGDVEVDSVQADRPRRSHRRGESCVYSTRHLDGKCTICREEHFDCNFMANNGQCSVCHKFAEECPPYASKSKYVIDKLLQLRNNDFIDGGSRRCNVTPMAARLFSTHANTERGHRPLKAIVFSQFRTIYEYFGDRLIRRFGGACVADYSYAKTRAQELQKFIQHPECFVMLLSKEGSVGLDLSFVTHIFFLDSIYDKSLEAQVVARAYRMGATGPVFVDELMAKDSVEEVMIQMNAKNQAPSHAPIDKKEKHAKLHLLLKSANLIRPRNECKTKKRKLPENDEDHMTDDQQIHDTMNVKQKSKACGVRFKD